VIQCDGYGAIDGVTDRFRWNTVLQRQRRPDRGALSVELKRSSGFGDIKEYLR
jgi:hypothetical protein